MFFHKIKVGNNMYKFSFIIPVYNAEKSIKKCVKSIQNQTYDNIEIVCVNDGSSDKSLTILSELQKQDNRIKIVNQKNSGAFQARKAGILASTGDYIMFADSDDLFCSNRSCEIIADTLSGKDVQLVQFSIKKRNNIFVQNLQLGVLGIITLRDIKEKYYKDYLSSKSDNVITTSLCNKAFDGRILRETIESFDTSLVLGEDLLLILHFLNNTDFKNLININDVLYQYNVGIGYSSKLDGTVLKQYSKLKKYQLFLCEQWNLCEDAIYYCNLESIYFLMVSVKKMISDKCDKNMVIDFIEESSGYECILLAKRKMREISPKYMFDELLFLISDYSPTEYYDYCLNHMPNSTIKSRIKKSIKKVILK